MSQFTQQLRNWAGAYIDHNAVDMTKLDGGWDFVLSWTPKAALQAAATSGDPSSGLTIFEAIDRQLGLKLTSQKHPMSVLVVDRVDQKPTNQ